MDTDRNLFVAPLARRRRRRLGASLMAGSLAAGAVLATFGTASAQEGPEVPEGAEPVEVQQTAFYEYPYSEAAPNTALAEFPPGVFCIVFPQAPVCQPNPVSDGVEGALDAGQENEPAPPASPVPPDTLPASLAGGEKRYESAVKFALPPLPADQTVGEFVIVLTETEPTYHSSSPVFRRAVLAALACVRECNRQEEFEKVLASEPVESAVLEVEVCPLTEPFDEGRSQEPPESQPVDCLFGATAQRIDGGDGKWIVDLTFAAQAWISGELENHGILIRPTGAPNLAYGDPDATTNAQVTFTQEILAASTAEPAPADPPAFGGGSFGDSSSGSAGSSGDFSAGNGGFSSAPSGGSSGGFSSDPFSAPAPVTADEAAAAPEVAPVDDGGAVSDAPVAGPATEPAATGSAWWLWLLIPVFAAGSWLTAQSLAAEPVVSSGAGSRNGAMTRLIARNQAAATPSTPMAQV
ncbi:MAG: hypothetical protein KY457_05650 [Actinobacteria bacterium]|nr:hypothetical protein [Actinomycetota bacterium]